MIPWVDWLSFFQLFLVVVFVFVDQSQEKEVFLNQLKCLLCLFFIEESNEAITQWYLLWKCFACSIFLEWRLNWDMKCLLCSHNDTFISLATNQWKCLFKHIHQLTCSLCSHCSDDKDKALNQWDCSCLFLDQLQSLICSNCSLETKDLDQ